MTFKRGITHTVSCMFLYVKIHESAQVALCLTRFKTKSSKLSRVSTKYKTSYKGWEENKRNYVKLEKCRETYFKQIKILMKAIGHLSRKDFRELRGEERDYEVSTRFSFSGKLLETI